MKTNQLRAKILQQTEEHLLSHGSLPASVSVLCKELKLKEPAFYAEFPSLAAVEKAIWKEWIDSIIHSVSKGAEWESFSAKERYLAFLFAFSQAALEKRSLLLVCFSKCCLHENPQRLEGLRQSFASFAQTLMAKGRETGEIANRGPLLSFYPEIFYRHFRWVLEFHLKDESDGFERTDAFIEKTVGLAFDLLGSQAIDSAADLARFLIPKKSWFHGGGQ